MTSVAPIDNDQDFADAAAAALEMVDAAKLDGQIAATKNKVNELLVALAKLIRDDDTLVDSSVRLRNLHSEILTMIAAQAAWQPKVAVACASTSNLALTGEQTIDGVLTSASRVLVKDQTAPAENGIYVTAAGAWTRAIDADASTELGLAAVYVTGGTLQGNTAWVQTVVAALIVVGTTGLTWVQYTGRGGTLPIAAGGTGATSAAAWPTFSKRRARIVSTSSLNIATPGATIDGVTMVAGDRVLLVAQVTASQNGLWQWNGAAVAMTRTIDFAAVSTVQAVQDITVAVNEGTANAGTSWRMTTAATVTIDTTAQTWAENVAMARATGASAARSLATRFSEVFNVRDFGAKGDGVTDDSTAIQAALTAANAAGGGLVFFPPTGANSYLATGLVWYANTHLLGCGGQSTTLKHKLSASDNVYLLSVNPGSGGTTSVSGNQRRMTMRGMRLLGTSSIDGFMEHQFLLNLNAVSDVLIEDNAFEDWRGDAIYIGSSNVGATERHNERITIRKCIFDGVTKVNRNAISVIDCKGLLVEDCFFTRCSRNDMPGAIDVEPDANAFAVIRDIAIVGNRFNDVGGVSGTINMLLPITNASLTTPSQHIVIERNVLEACTNGITLNVATQPLETDDPHDIVVRANYLNAAGDGIKWQNLKGLKVLANHIENIFSNADIGWNTAGFVTLDVLFQGNRLVKCGYGGSAGYVLAIHAHKRITFDANEFIDCGKSDGTVGIIFDFNDGTSDYVTISNNRVRCPTAPQRTTYLVRKEAAHTFTGGNNREFGNDLGGLILTDQFVHTASGEVLTGSVVWDAPSIASGASTTTTLTVTGAALEDFVQASANLTIAGCALTGFVSATDTVTLVLTNNTGVAVNLGNATYDVRLTKK